MSFKSFAYTKDEGFDEYDFIKCADLEGTPIKIKKVLKKAKMKDKTEYYKCVVDVNGVFKSTVFLGTSLVSTINNICTNLNIGSELGQVLWEDSPVADEVVFIRQVKSINGRDMYVFSDE